jgi:hypothetical protein
LHTVNDGGWVERLPGCRVAEYAGEIAKSARDFGDSTALEPARKEINQDRCGGSHRYFTST